MASSSSAARRIRAPRLPRTAPAPREFPVPQPSAPPLTPPAPSRPQNPSLACSPPSAFRRRDRRKSQSPMPTPARLAAHSSYPGPPLVRALYRSGSSAAAPSFAPSTSHPQSMLLPSSQPHRRPRPRRPILPSLDSTTPPTLPSRPCWLRSALVPIGTPCPRPPPPPSTVPSPQAPT